MVRMSLCDTLDRNTIHFARWIHPNYDLKNIETDMNYFVYSRDEYMNFLVTSEIIERLSGVKRCHLSAKECDGIPFSSHLNVLCLDVAVIPKKSRPDIDSFIRRIVRRKPLLGGKHIVVVTNFHEICTRYQLNFKSLLEANSANACFLFTSTKMQVGVDCLYSFFMTLRTPTLSKQESQKLLNEVVRVAREEERGARAGSDEPASDVLENFSSAQAKIDHQLPLYAQMINLNAHINGGRTYVNVFKREIFELIDFLKTSKKKPLEKIISHIRAVVNKVLYYSVPDNVICSYIAQKISSLKKIDKGTAIVKICEAEKNLVSSSKKIFVYELLLIELYELLCLN